MVSKWPEDRARPVSSATPRDSVHNLSSRLALQQFVLKLGRKPSNAERLDLAKRRQRLQARIDGFVSGANRILGAEVLENIPLDDRMTTITTVEINDSDSDGDSDDNESPTQNFIGNAELLPLPFPSATPKAAQQIKSIRSLMHKEAELRAGQCNDSLETVRECIVNLSFEYRTKVRGAKTNRQSTRAWTGVKSLKRKLRQHRTLYNMNRDRLISIRGASRVEEFPFLEKKHCDWSDIISDPNSAGLSNSRLAWIWQKSDVMGDGQYSKECELNF